MKPPERQLSNSDSVNQHEFVAVVRGVSMFFCDPEFVRALTDVSFAVRRGEVFALLGPKGSGKSIALKLLDGRLGLTEGKVKLFGRSPRRGAIKRRIGYLPDRTSQPESGGLLGFFRELFAGLKRGRGKAVGESSQGTQRHTSLAQAILGGRDLVILDEPFSGLDPANCHDVKDLIRTLARRGKTVIFSSNSLSDAKDICDRMLIFSGGKIQVTGTLNELLARPDAVCSLAPVLPWATSERVLKIIREEVGGDTTLIDVAKENPGNDIHDAAHQLPHAGPSNAETAVEKVLAPLMRPAKPAPPPKPPNESTDPVNHERLAELTKPATTSAGPQPEKMTDESSRINS